MMSKTARLSLHVFATLLLVAAMLTGVWQQNHVLRQLADPHPATPVERVAAYTEAGARGVQAGRNGLDRSCPRLLHLDATLAWGPPTPRHAGCAIAHETATLLTPEEYARSVATPPPRRRPGQHARSQVT